MTKKLFHLLLDELHLFLVVDVHERVVEEKEFSRKVVLQKNVIGGCTKNVKDLAQKLLSIATSCLLEPLGG